MKRILISVLSLVLVLSLGACGCNKNEVKPQKEEETPLATETETMAISIEETLVNYFTAYEAYDFEEAGKYLLDKSAIEDVSEPLETVIDTHYSNNGAKAIMTESAFSSIKEMAKDMYEKALENMVVEVSDVKEENNSATAKVSVKYIPLDTIIQATISGPFGIAVENAGYAEVDDPTTLADEDWENIFSELLTIMEVIAEDESFMSTQEIDMELQKKDGIWYIDIE